MTPAGAQSQADSPLTGALPPPLSDPQVLAYASPGTFSAPAAQAKLRFVDALRGMAIFGVLVVHVTTSIRGLPEWFKPLGRDGARGVQLFYIVSAFTLFLSMSRRSKRERRPTVNFFIRRFARISPLFYASVLLYFLIYGFCFQLWRSAPSVTVGTVISTLTFTNAWHPYWITALVPGGWSVAIEMCFYLTVPLLFLWIKSWRWALVLVIVSAAVGLPLTSYVEHHPPRQFSGPHEKRHSRKVESRAALIPASSASAPLPPPWYALGRAAAIRAPRSAPAAAFNRIESWKTFMLFWLPNQFSVFALGILLFFIYEERAGPWQQAAELRQGLRVGKRRGRYDQRRLSLSLLVLLIEYMSLQIWVLPRSIRGWLPDMIVYGIVFVILALALAMYENPVLVNRFWTHLGKVSYSAYLLHWSVLLVLEKTIGHWLAHFPPLMNFLLLLSALTLATIVVSTITFHLIEQPGQLLGKRLIRALEHRAGSSVVPVAEKVKP